MLQKRHGCVVLNRCFARAVVVFVACCRAHQQLDECTTRGLRSGCAGSKTRARAFRVLGVWEDSLARHTLAAGVLRTGWHAWRSRSLPGLGSLVRRRSTSAISFVRDDRARVGATPSARPGRRSEASLRAQAPKPCESRFGARGRPRENTTGYERGRRGGPSSAAGGSSVAAPPRQYRSCSFMLGPMPLHGGIGPSYPSYGGRGS